MNRRKSPGSVSPRGSSLSQNIIPGGGPVGSSSQGLFLGPEDFSHGVGKRRVRELTVGLKRKEKKRKEKKRKEKKRKEKKRKEKKRLEIMKNKAIFPLPPPSLLFLLSLNSPVRKRTDRGLGSMNNLRVNPRGNKNVGDTNAQTIWRKGEMGEGKRRKKKGEEEEEGSFEEDEVEEEKRGKRREGIEGREKKRKGTEVEGGVFGDVTIGRRDILGLHRGEIGKATVFIC